jgi:serralysin
MASAAYVSIPSSANVAGVVYGTKWTSALTYSFPDSTTDYGSYTHSATGFVQVSFEQRQAVRQILEGSSAYSGGPVFKYGSFEAVCNINISEAADFLGYSDLMFGQVDTFDGSNLGTARVADFPIVEGPPVRNSAGDVFFGDDPTNSYRNPIPGSYEWQTHIHEIGHAMGLKHGHNAGSPFNSVTLPYDRDSMEFSVMTYRSYVGGSTTAGYSNETYGYAQTLMMSDIAALQYLYGADFTTNAGNTIYTWSPTTGEMFLNGAGQGAPGANRIFLTIWDGGGSDTYDMSNYGNAVAINLNPGLWSTTSNAQKAYLGYGNYARANVFNAYLYNGDARSYIENAIGGSGDDVIVGNAVRNVLRGSAGADFLSSLGGSDTLIGGVGRDTLNGGTGRDFFDFNGKTESTAGSNRDVIQSFQHGEDDTIDLRTIDAVTGGINNAFRFIGADTFAHFKATHAGVYGMVRVTAANLIQIDIGGNKTVDMEIKVIGSHLVASDFLL